VKNDIVLRFNSYLLNLLRLIAKSRIHQKAIAQITLISFIFSLSLSCASAPPARVFVTKDQLSKYNAVALNVSCSALDVRYYKEDLEVLTLTGLEYLIRSLVDSHKAEGVKEALGEDHFERILGNYFLEQFTKANLFRKVNYSAHADNHKALVAEGYDSIITLKIEDFCLKRAGYFNAESDKVKLYITVVANMIDLQNEQVLWSQYELVVSDEERTFDEYKADGSKLLKALIDRSLRKLSLRLAYDITYSK